MSAWIVSEAHIDALVQAAIVEKIITLDKADVIGQLLWGENHKSIAYRYSHRPDIIDEMFVDGWEEYTFEGIEAPFDDMALLKQVRCYDYQTCEHPTYKESFAYALVRELDTILTARLGLGTPDTFRGYNHPAYDAAPWGIESLDQIVAHATA